MAAPDVEPQRKVMDEIHDLATRGQRVAFDLLTLNNVTREQNTTADAIVSNLFALAGVSNILKNLLVVGSRDKQTVGLLPLLHPQGIQDAQTLLQTWTIALTHLSRVIADSDSYLDSVAFRSPTCEFPHLLMGSVLVRISDCLRGFCLLVSIARSEEISRDVNNGPATPLRKEQHRLAESTNRFKCQNECTSVLLNNPPHVPQYQSWGAFGNRNNNPFPAQIDATQCRNYVNPVAVKELQHPSGFRGRYGEPDYPFLDKKQYVQLDPPEAGLTLNKSFEESEMERYELSCKGKYPDPAMFGVWPPAFDKTTVQGQQVDRMDASKVSATETTEKTGGQETKEDNSRPRIDREVSVDTQNEFEVLSHSDVGINTPGATRESTPAAVPSAAEHERDEVPREGQKTPIPQAPLPVPQSKKLAFGSPSNPAAKNLRPFGSPPSSGPFAQYAGFGSAFAQAGSAPDTTPFSFGRKPSAPTKEQSMTWIREAVNAEVAKVMQTHKAEVCKEAAKEEVVTTVEHTPPEEVLEAYTLTPRAEQMGNIVEWSNKILKLPLKPEQVEAHVKDLGEDYSVIDTISTINPSNWETIRAYTKSHGKTGGTVVSIQLSRMVSMPTTFGIFEIPSLIFVIKVAKDHDCSKFGDNTQVAQPFVGFQTRGGPFGGTPIPPPTGGLFGQKPVGGGLFGAPQASGATQTGGLFGQRPSGGRLFGPPQTSGDTHAGGLFGQRPLGGALFGAPQPSATTEPTTTSANGEDFAPAPPTGGLFGNPSQQRPSPFSNCNPTSHFDHPQPSIFDNPQRTSPFGQTQQIQGFGNPQSSLFGQSQQPQTSPFGQTQPSIFDKPPQTSPFNQPQQTPGFGNPRPSLFGQLQQQQTSPFGQPQQSSGFSASLFSQSQQTSQPSPFGQAQQPTTATAQPSLFGQTQPSVSDYTGTAQTQPSNLFGGVGAPAAPQAASSAGFGGLSSRVVPQSTSTIDSGNIFASLLKPEPEKDTKDVKDKKGEEAEQTVATET